MRSRRKALALVLGLTLVAATFVLYEVWAVVLFAITVAYVLVPLQRRLTGQGLSKWWASTVATTTGTIAAVVPFAVAFYLGYRRRDSITEFLQTVPDVIEVDLLGMAYEIHVETVFKTVESGLSSALIDLAGALPELGLKATLFAFVLFGLLMSHEAVEEAMMNAVPTDYRAVIRALARRAEMTLNGIYVLQAATASATFFIAVVVFWALGYDIPITLAFLSGILQFVPIVGPSILIAGLAAYHVIVGDVMTAILAIVIAGFFVAWLPDVLVRPKLSKRAGNLSGTLYFVGFVGGLLTVGPIGIIVGPLAVALVAESMQLLSEETPDE